MDVSKEFGKALVEKATAGKVGHRVVVIGGELFSSVNAEELELENCEVTFLDVNNLSKLARLNSYTLVIIAYQAFSNDRRDYQPIFLKQMNEALEQGISFCFIYYNEPAIGRNGYNTESLCITQVATQFVVDSEIGLPYQTESIIHDGKIKRKEFANYLKKWGSSQIHFQLSKQAESLYETKNGETLGFSVSMKLGNVFFLPFIRNFSKSDDIKEGLRCLIDSILTYLAKSRIDLPVWAKEESFFTDEETFLKEKFSLQKRVSELDTSLQEFDEAKSLLFHNEHHLEITLPNFLKNYLGLGIEQNETYIEDFWLTDKNSKKLAIAEIKSKTKGFTKGLVHFVLSHKEVYELDEDFPALLFVNCNLQAGSWKDKDKPLNTEECKYIKNHNVLVIRIEDVVRLWEMKRTGKITEKEILELFLTKKGWLHITPTLQIEVKPK